MSKNILVMLEQREGRILPASYQLFTPARKLAQALGGQVVACLVGDAVSALTGAVGAYQPQTIYTVEHPELKFYRAGAYAAAACAVIDEAQPKGVLFATSFMGRDWAARTAARKRGALAIDCTELVPDGEDLIASKTLYAGKVTAAFRLSSSRLQVATVRANVFSAPAPQSGASAPVQAVPVNFSPADTRVVVKQVVQTSSGIKDVTEADAIVAGGRALKNEEGFQKVIFPLAAALDGAVGASRAACDAGYQPHSRQVGLTGKVVTPKLYIACGIDGAIQHLAGMRGSKVIVAVNTKKEAPIFKVATYGCVADLFALVPLITEEVKKLHAH
ncbi:MAG: electron transfer flavoprotein subunit alpha/FixB family protein [Phycisphaerales bacterium]|nr:electron transfer flavoprotein subunit alpha/FixB family protein [Phycisphaerales bacterium]